MDGGSLLERWFAAGASGDFDVAVQGLFARIADGKIVEAWEIVDAASPLRQLEALPES